MSKDLKQYFSIDDYYAYTTDFSVIPQKVGEEYRLVFDIYTDLKSSISISRSKLYFNLKTGGDLTMQEFTQGSPSGHNHTTFYLIIPESSLDKDYLNVNSAFWSSTGRQFTLSDNKSSTGVFVSSSWYNDAPTINGKESQNINLGEKNEPFSITYKVNDTDENDILTVKEYLDGGLLKTRSNAIRNTSYSIDISREQLYSLSESGTHTISVSVSDGNTETTTNWKFVRVNLVPELIIISDFDESTIFKASSPSITYSVNDPEGEEVKVGILVDGEIIQPLEVVTQNENHEISIDHDNWITILNGKHTFTLQAEDAQGGISTKEYTFIKNEDTIEIQLKEPIKTDSAVQGIYLTIIKGNVNSNSVSVMVTNNGLDETPTWEDATEKVLSMSKYTFTNTSKTADNFALDVKIAATRTTETGTIKILGIGGSMV